MAIQHYTDFLGYGTFDLDGLDFDRSARSATMAFGFKCVNFGVLFSKTDETRFGL